ncbi:MAG: histidine kinase [Deltaproteobacteria bacterium]|nr:histidine kinase [Deltaproteobacteria bacterium]
MTCDVQSLVAWEIRYRRWALRISAALVALWLVFDALSPGANRVVLAVRFLWSGCLLCASLLQRPERPRLAALSTAAATVGTALASVAVVAGREDGHLVGLCFLLAMPLIGLAVTPRVISTPVIASTITVSGGAAILVDMGSSPVVVAEWISLAAISAIAAAYCTRANRREAERVIAAEREHARAVEGLAESERRRGQSDKLAIAGWLTTGVAHEMNNPLAFVRSNLCWIRDRHAQAGLADPELSGVFDETMAGIDRMAQIVSDLRVFGRNGSDTVTPCSPAGILEEALRLASLRLRAVRVERVVAADLPPVLAAHGRAVQALVNLLANAGDAVEHLPAEARWIRVEARREGAAIRIDVDDGGPGLSEAVKARLFEPFVTTKSAGTGLGLSLTREFLLRFGATVEACRAPGAGARFTVRIPVAPAAVGGDSGAPPARPRPAATSTELRRSA